VELVKEERRVAKSEGELFVIKTFHVGREINEVYRGNPAWLQERLLDNSSSPRAIDT